jgi:hypothetical protein
MDTLQDLFEHNRQLRIIVCKSCSIAIPPRHIAAHLRAHHPKTPVEVQLKIAEATHTLPNLAWELHAVYIPTPAAECIATLSCCCNAYTCAFPSCWHTCTTLRMMRDHCSKEHGWVGNQRRGGDMKKMQAQPSNQM